MMLKICGMTRQADLDCAQELGFDFCGFIFHAKSPRHLAPQMAAGLQSGVMRRVGVFVEHEPGEILEIMRIARLDYAQLHGDYDREAVALIGAGRVIRVLWPQRYAAREAMLREAAKADCAWYLLDAGPSGGGSGAALAWRELAGLALPAPWFLAGGLAAGNVGPALAACSPHGLDFNSGLEQSHGCKSHAKMRAAVRALAEREAR
ncbi:MAG: phosphoribosylanthranilate isomerase [Desulfovibrio sp.]|nr:phosphoribosylanthranilate isomerase [Desulfovibrio sp.]